MGKLSKEEVARYSGAEWMVRYVKEHGLEAAEKELQLRGIRQMPLGVKDTDLKRFSVREKNNTIATVLLMAVSVLHDEFDYGEEPLNRFIKRFNDKTACLVDEYVYWKDLQQTIKEETGIFIPLLNEFLEMGEE